MLQDRLRDGIVRPDDVEPGAIMRVMRVPPELAGTRVDRFLQGQLRATSRTRSQLIIQNAAFTPDGKRLKKNHRVQAEERVILWRPPWDEIAPIVDLPVVYEDEAILAINKPPFVPVHPTARYHKSTVTEIMREMRPDESPRLIHRLDRETSGVLLLARTPHADRTVKIQLEARVGVIKIYLALCWGAPAWSEHKCELPIEPDPNSRYRVKMHVAAPGAGLPSTTGFELIETRHRPDDPARRYSKIRCILHTGRQHQIRVHLAALGVPIVGDKLYGPDEDMHAKGSDGTIEAADLTVLEHDRQALHASVMEFDHPTTGKRLRVEAPLYPDLVSFWDALA